MNVIVSNRQKEIIDNANIDAIKDLNGLFNVDDLVNKFKNYFFSKMILDATSVVDFATHDVLQKLTDEIGSDRLIILLPATPEPPDEFKKMLIDLKIYNFSNNIDDVVSFIEKPNTYENALNTINNSYKSTDDYYVDNSIKEGEDKDPEFDVEDSVDNTDYSDEDVSDNYSVNNNHTSLGDIMSRFNVYNDDNTLTTDSNIDKEDIKVEENNENAVNNLDNSQNDLKVETNAPISDNEMGSSYRFLNIDGFDDFENDQPQEKMIIGIKNVTLHAGSTTLIYLLQKEAKKRNKDIVSIEVNKNDFKLFRSSKMISIKEDELSDTLNSLRESLVFIDLNDCSDVSFCNEILYLVEPSLIKLNKLMMENKDIFSTLANEKVILNKSMLTLNDVSVLEKEANMKFFYSLGSINDRLDNSAISELFDKLVND